MLLSPPLGLRSIEFPDGRVLELWGGQPVDVPESVVFEFLDAGWKQAEAPQREIQQIPGPEGPPGPPGEPGHIGPMPKHEWRDTELRFEIAPHQWGKWTDLQGPPGRTTHALGGGGSITKIIQGGTGTGDGSVPYFIPVGDTFTVPIYRQALFERTIDCEGLMDIVGDLIMVT